MKHFITALTITFFVCSALAGENFSIKSKVDSVKADGYYKIQLNCDVISFAKADYSDIRLVNSKGDEIPYILTEEPPATPKTGFNEYPIIVNEYNEKKKQSRVVIHNLNRQIISELVLVIRNSDIEKEITLRGSDNKINWFIIQKGFPYKTGVYNETSGVFKINFQKSDFEFLEISTTDKQKDPLQFLKAGYYDSKVMQGLYSEVPVKSFIQKDSSDRRTYLFVNFERPCEIGKIELDIAGPEFYKRDAVLGNFSQVNNRRVFTAFSAFGLSSEKHSAWETEKLKMKEIAILIENHDNKPLKIENVRFYQLNKYITAKLEKGETYYIRAGNPNLSYPEYDLKYFLASIPDSLTTLNSEKINLPAGSDTENSPVIFTQTVLWVVISIVIILLGVLSVRTIREMNKSKH